MACRRLVGAKWLSEPMLEYYQLDPWEQTLMKFQSKSIHFHSRKSIWNCRLENGGHFVSASMLHEFYMVNICSGNGLSPDGTKPFPEKLLTWDPRHAPQCNFTEKDYDVSNKHRIWKLYFQNLLRIFLRPMSLCTKSLIFQQFSGYGQTRSIWLSRQQAQWVWETPS